MPRQQKPLPLGSPREASPDAMKKALDKVRRTVTSLAKVSEEDPREAASACEKVIAALQDLNVRVEGWVRHLDERREEHAVRLEATFDRRREDLARAAREDGRVVVHRQKYDIVDCIRVDYAREKVTLRLGSAPGGEKLDSFDEVDGTRLFSRLRHAREALEQFPFDRSGFLQNVKDAIGLAKTQQRDRDGKVPVRELYLLVALVRQSRDGRFLRKPDSKSFVDYSIVQFAYDFARFGLDGWTTDQGERLFNQPPNMATIARGEALILPSLDRSGVDGSQLGSIWIERSGRGRSS